MISSSALKRRMDDPLLSGSLCLVDVRMPEEQQVSMLPGSLTAAEFDARREELKGRTVVCYCTVGYRSSSHASKLRQQGVDAKNLEGGIIRWVRAAGRGGGVAGRQAGTPAGRGAGSAAAACKALLAALLAGW